MGNDVFPVDGRTKVEVELGIGEGDKAVVEEGDVAVLDRGI